MKVELTCPICESNFEAEKRYFNFSEKKGWKIYCSKQCREKAREKKIKYNCDTCGKEIYKTPSDIKASKSGKVFCSRTCSTIFTNKEYKSGTNHPNYKNGGGSYRDIKLRSCENICEDCGNDDVRVLEVHHIDKNRKNNDINNLAILCANCHKIRHYNGVVG